MVPSSTNESLGGSSPKMLHRRPRRWEMNESLVFLSLVHWFSLDGKLCYAAMDKLHLYPG